MTTLLLLLALLTPPHCNVCDLDRDGDCDTADYALFVECFDAGQPTPTPIASPSPTPVPTPDPSPDPAPTPSPVSGDLASIQAAINAAQPGAIVTIAAGHYRWANPQYANTLTLRDVTLVGTGTVILDGGATYTGTTNAQTGCKQVVTMTGASGLKNVTVQNGHRYGVYIPSGAATLDGVVARHNGLHNTNAESGGIFAKGGTGHQVINCAAFNNYSGINITRSTDWLMEYCIAVGNGWMDDGTVLGFDGDNSDGLSTNAARSGSARFVMRSVYAAFNGDDNISGSHSTDGLIENAVAMYSGRSPGGLSVINSPGHNYKLGNHAANIYMGEARGCTFRNLYSIGPTRIDLTQHRGYTVENAYAWPGTFSGGNGWNYEPNTACTLRNIYAQNIISYPTRAPHVTVNLDETPDFANPDAPIDATWQGSARATFEHVWGQVATNFEVR